MRQILITISKGIIEQVMFFDDPKSAVYALSSYVRAMNPEHDDAVVYDTSGMIANAKHFLDDHDEYVENKDLIEDVSRENHKSLYIIGNPEHYLGFMVASPDDPIGYDDPAEAISTLGQMRQDHGKHLKLYWLVPVNGPIGSRLDLEKYNAEAMVEDFRYPLVEEHIR